MMVTTATRTPPAVPASHVTVTSLAQCPQSATRGPGCVCVRRELPVKTATSAMKDRDMLSRKQDAHVRIEKMFSL